MLYSRFLSMSAFLLSATILLSACTETRYVAHLAKQVPLPTDTPKTAGYFKVGNPYHIKGRKYYPQESYDHVETGIASWYGPGFHGKQTANGEIFDENELTAAHRTLQMPSLVRVTNLENGKSLILRVNDRGPFAHNRVIDVSKKAADLLGFKIQGTARVKVEVIPKESRIIAEVAKERRSTSGVEVAMNRSGRLPSHFYSRSDVVLADAGAGSLSPRKPLQNANIQTANATPNSMPQPLHDDGRGITPRSQFTDIMDKYADHTARKNNEHMPQDEIMTNKVASTDMSEPYSAPLVEQYPIKASKLYVQAGSFSTEDNARALKAALGELGENISVQQANVQGRTFHRVRLGPFDSVARADQAMVALEQKGRYGTIVVVD